jgi:hypothetical protein
MKCISLRNANPTIRCANEVRLISFITKVFKSARFALWLNNKNENSEADIMTGEKGMLKNIAVYRDRYYDRRERYSKRYGSS